MKTSLVTISVLLFSFFGITSNLGAAVKVFDGTTDLANYKSAVYSVQVQQNEEPFQNSFVVGYLNDYTGIANVGTISRMNHFTTFEFDGQVKVEITLLTGNITTAKILPDVDFEGNPFYTNKEIRDGKLYLTIPKNNEKLYVEINGNLNEPLYLFADNFSPTYSGDNVFEAPTTFNGAVAAGKNTVVFRSGKIYTITQTSGGTPNKWTIPDAVDIVN